MTFIATFFETVTFQQVLLALITCGVIERGFYMLPKGTFEPLRRALDFGRTR